MRVYVSGGRLSCPQRFLSGGLDSISLFSFLGARSRKAGGGASRSLVQKSVCLKPGGEGPLGVRVSMLLLLLLLCLVVVRIAGKTESKSGERRLPARARRQKNPAQLNPLLQFSPGNVVSSMIWQAAPSTPIKCPTQSRSLRSSSSLARILLLSQSSIIKSSQIS